MYWVRDRIGHFYVQVTLTYKVTGPGLVSGPLAIHYIDPKNLRNKNKIFALSHLLAMMSFHVMTSL